MRNQVGGHDLSRDQQPGGQLSVQAPEGFPQPSPYLVSAEGWTVSDDHVYLADGRGC